MAFRPPESKAEKKPGLRRGARLILGNAFQQVRLRRQKIRIWLAWSMGFLTALGLLLVFTLWMAGVVYSRLPTAASLGPEFKKVDVVVCLAGGRGRIRRAFELFESGLGDHLYISGTDPSVSMRGILRELGWVGPVEDSSRITIEAISTNTIENAREVAKFLEKTQRKSILLVTSIYHVRRAYFIFKKVLPPNIDIKVTWFEREPFEPDDWWKSANGIWVTVGEFFKFFYAYLRLNFPSQYTTMNLPYSPSKSLVHFNFQDRN